jgi:RodZ C-terminal domain
VLTASRGDSWLEVRSSSSPGTVLYKGTLTTGSTRTFHAASIWVRFGAASNLDARLNGSTLDLPIGTYSALFDSGGFHKVRG